MKLDCGITETSVPNIIDNSGFLKELSYLNLSNIV